ELSAVNRGWHADLPDSWRGHRRRDALDGPHQIDALDRADVVGKAKLHRLGAVGDRTAVDRDDEIGVGRTGLIGGWDNGLAREMRRHRIEGAGIARPECM